MGTPVITYLSISDLSNANALIGSTSTVAVDAGIGTYLSENLDGSGYVWLTYWDNAFANNNLNIANLDASPVPEPTTMVAGALLLLPFGASTLRMLRRKQTA